MGLVASGGGTAEIRRGLAKGWARRLTGCMVVVRERKNGTFENDKLLWLNTPRHGGHGNI